jgi:flavin reductase ActVB
MTHPTGSPALDERMLKDALAHFPSGVTIVTVRDAAGVAHGFTASAFCSVSLDPPLVCFCVARSARCHPVFAGQDEFVINFLGPQHAELAMRFARREADKFADGPFCYPSSRLVVLKDAVAVLECAVYSRLAAGDHTIVVGAVRRVEVSPGEPLVYFNRTFHRLSATPAAPAAFADEAPR